MSIPNKPMSGFEKFGIEKVNTYKKFMIANNMDRLNFFKYIRNLKDNY